MAVLPLSNVVVERMKNAQSRHPLVSVRDWNDERSRLRGKNGRPINHGHSSAKTSLRRTSQPISVQRNVFPNKGFSASTSRVMCLVAVPLVPLVKGEIITPALVAMPLLLVASCS